MNKRAVIAEIRRYLEEELGRVPDAGARREIQRLLMMYRFLPSRDHAESDVIAPSSLVELSLDGTRAFYFIVPMGGGLVTRVEGSAVQVITPQSPLGEALLGRKAGERVRVAIRGGEREYVILGVT